MQNPIEKFVKMGKLIDIYMILICSERKEGTVREKNPGMDHRKF